MMKRTLLAIWLTIFMTASAKAGEYCARQYEGEITAVNAELGGLVKRQGQIEEIFLRKAKRRAEKE